MPSVTHARGIGITAALLALACLPAAAWAQESSYDPPAVSTGVPGHAKQALTITAGATGAPAGFTVRWMTKAQLDSYGGVWPSEPVPGEGSASFTGVPTLNTADGLYDTFQLEAAQAISIEIGDLLDETGVEGTPSELLYNTDYVFQVVTNGDAQASASGPSEVANGKTTDNSQNCTFTVGYWKNHPLAWPVNSLTLGTHVYTMSELLDILNTPAEGNGLISLAHQLIAAKLNIANGADATSISSTIADADALIDGQVVPPSGGGYIFPGDSSSLTQALDDFNNGVSGPGHCAVTPVNATSWGGIKSLYR